jgi:hypothetical protein
MPVASRKTSPYVFYGQTTSLRGIWRELVPAEIAIEGEQIEKQIMPFATYNLIYRNGLIRGIRARAEHTTLEVVR